MFARLIRRYKMWKLRRWQEKLTVKREEADRIIEEWLRDYFD